jgi:hypothetical protein
MPQARTFCPSLSCRARPIAATFDLLTEQFIKAVNVFLAKRILSAHPAVNLSLTAQHHNAFDRSDCLHGRAVSPPESSSQSRGARGYPRWSVFGFRSIATQPPAPAMERIIDMGR